MTTAQPVDVIRCEMSMPDTGEIVGVLVPKQRWLFDRMFQPGGEYTIEIHEPRSNKSQSHYHAVLRNAWLTMPDNTKKRFVDPDHLRKWSLIQTGWAIERTVACESATTAHAVAATSAALDESAVIIVQGTIVTIATARSQKTTGPGSMNKEEFQKSKQDVLEYVAGLLGVDVSTLSSQVPNSSDGDGRARGNQAPDRTDTPAGAGPQPKPAGVTYSGQPSKLKPDWFDTYVMVMTQSQNRALSALTRDEKARNLTGAPNEWERDLQRRIATLVIKRDKNKVSANEFQAGIAAIRAEWAAAIKGASHAA